MCTQQTDSVEPGAAFAADSSSPSESLAASIPPELFKNVLAYVGDEGLLVNRDILDTTSPNHVSTIAARRDEMRHLSACTLTCVYWAQLTRERMFERLILRSSKDMSSLLSFIRAPQSPRIPPICDILQYLNVYYTLGDQPWFHNLAGLQSRYRVSCLGRVTLYITGPATPAFVAASARGSMLHPLFFAAPRVLLIPAVFPEGCDFLINIRGIHLPNPTMFFNLVQDCLSLRPHHIDCTNLTWVLDPAIQATPSSIGLKYAHRLAYRGYSWTSILRCTDNVLVAAMLKSVPHREFSQQHRGPYLDPLETSYLFDVMRTAWCVLPLEAQRTERLQILSDADPDSIQRNVAKRLPPGTDFCLQWEVDDFYFWCIASRLPHAPATSNNVQRNITYIIIDLQFFADHHELRRRMKKATINWDTFLPAGRQFPHFRQILIQWTGSLEFPRRQLITVHIGPLNSSPRQILVEFLAHLGGAWFALDEPLGLYYRKRGRFEWAQLQLETLMDEIKQMRAEIKAEADAEKGASSTPESGVVESESTASADLQAQISSAAASQDSRETFQLADSEVEILPEHIALQDEARQRQIEETELETDPNKAALSELESTFVTEEGSTHDE